eukprot:1156444-Amphidinium_carterae.1
MTTRMTIGPKTTHMTFYDRTCWPTAYVKPRRLRHRHIFDLKSCASKSSQQRLKCIETEEYGLCTDCVHEAWPMFVLGRLCPGLSGTEAITLKNDIKVYELVYKTLCSARASCWMRNVMNEYDTTALCEKQHSTPCCTALAMLDANTVAEILSMYTWEFIRSQWHSLLNANRRSRTKLPSHPYLSRQEIGDASSQDDPQDEPSQNQLYKCIINWPMGENHAIHTGYI